MVLPSINGSVRICTWKSLDEAVHCGFGTQEGIEAPTFSGSKSLRKANSFAKMPWCNSISALHCGFRALLSVFQAMDMLWICFKECRDTKCEEALMTRLGATL